MDGAVVEGKRLVPTDSAVHKTIITSNSLSTRHVLPKSSVSKALLNQNPSCQRHLDMQLQRLRRRRMDLVVNLELGRRAFLEAQCRKHRDWKRNDETRATNMNLPYLQRPPSKSSGYVMDMLYKSPLYRDVREEAAKKTADDIVQSKTGHTHKLPYMLVRRESTEIVRNNGKTFITRLPTIVDTDPFKLHRYNTFCGVEPIRAAPVKDQRFLNAVSCLTPRIRGPADRELHQERTWRSYPYSSHNNKRSSISVMSSAKSMTSSGRSRSMIRSRSILSSVSSGPMSRVSASGAQPLKEVSFARNVAVVEEVDADEKTPPTEDL